MRWDASRKAPSSPTTSPAWPCASRRSLREHGLQPVDPAEARAADLARTLLGEGDAKASGLGRREAAIRRHPPLAQIEECAVVDDLGGSSIRPEIDPDLNPRLARILE